MLVLGSGALQIGQAGEFDYSGSQAIKALREEGIHTVLVNPNIATIQTSGELADRIYLVAVTPELVEQIIVKEQVDAILLSFGGQTALNCGLALARRAACSRATACACSARRSRRSATPKTASCSSSASSEIGVKTARSQRLRTSRGGARRPCATIGLPVMLRGGFALGGKGSGIVDDASRSRRRAAPRVRRRRAAGAGRGIPARLEGDRVRGRARRARQLHHRLQHGELRSDGDPYGRVDRRRAVADAERRGIPAAALDRDSRRSATSASSASATSSTRSIRSSVDYRVIEVNARLSRSSALASKATGYPLAYVAAKIGLGYSLPEIPNGITRRTTAFFEPALDYLVCKVPRWDLDQVPRRRRRRSAAR